MSSSSSNSNPPPLDDDTTKLESNTVEKDNTNNDNNTDNNASSWMLSNLLDLVTPTWEHNTSSNNNNNNTKEQQQSPPAPSPSTTLSSSSMNDDNDVESPTGCFSPNDNPKKKKNVMLQRASTVSTILGDSEHFGLEQHGQEGWEVSLAGSSSSFSSKVVGRFVERYTRRPQFVRRCAILALVGIIVIILPVTITTSAINNNNNNQNVSAADAAEVSTSPVNPTTDTTVTGGTPPFEQEEVDDGSGNLVSSSPPSDIFDNNTPPSPTNDDDDDGRLDLDKPASPFSILDPTDDLGMFGVVHSRIPPVLVGDDENDKNKVIVPTNAWYQNLLLGATNINNNNNESNDLLLYKAYVVPYLIDVVAGPIPGLRTHVTHLETSTDLVKVQIANNHGLTLGAAASASVSVGDGGSTNNYDKAYSIVSTNPLGLTLQWNALGMTSSIIRGMPYSTMHYPKSRLPFSSNGIDNNEENMLPTIASEVALQSPILVDSSSSNTDQDDVVVLECTSSSSQSPPSPPTRVEHELKLTLVSDATWMVFFSQPVLVRCIENGANGVQVQVVQLANDDEEDGSSSRLTVRTALLTSCTNNLNAIHCANNDDNNNLNANDAAIAGYESLLRERAHLYPGPHADVRHGVNHTAGKAVVRMDWNVQDMTKEQETTNDVTNIDGELLMYALPHHLTRMMTDESKWMPWGQRFCVSSLSGSTCAVTGSVWDVEEDLPIASFRAPRPPRVEALPEIAKALKDDITYVIPENFQRGAGDTYFSGKVLARVGRVLLIHEELEDLCNGKAVGYDLNDEQKLAYMNVCLDLPLPTDEEITASLDMLRRSVEVWINGTAEASFAYDSGWGGVINCGCVWDGGGCSNSLPDCPAITPDGQGLNFGSAFYNDHHFHYGYHINAAATLAHFDREWGRRHFEDVLLLIRDIANPSEDDPFFPVFRHKDWYQGSSWASGLTLPTFENIVNQESTSEAIAGYEAVALYGREMMLAWDEVDQTDLRDISRGIQDAGLVAAATEIRSTNYYWHVRRGDDSKEIYPSGYQHYVVGILWSTMIQFTTWFGNAPYLIYGIQLLPLTPIAESRDANQDWLQEMYEPLARSCVADAGCTSHGWSVLQLAMLASIGHADMAMEQAQHIPDGAFDSPGGNGHSMTNTLHYFATRPRVDEPANVAAHDFAVDVVEPESTLDCGVPQTCTLDVLSTNAAGYTCLERISWLMDVNGLEETVACQQVGRAEFPTECGKCVNSAV